MNILIKLSLTLVIIQAAVFSYVESKGSNEVYDYPCSESLEVEEVDKTILQSISINYVQQSMKEVQSKVAIEYMDSYVVDNVQIQENDMDKRWIKNLYEMILYILQIVTRIDENISYTSASEKEVAEYGLEVITELFRSTNYVYLNISREINEGSNRIKSLFSDTKNQLKNIETELWSAYFFAYDKFYPDCVVIQERVNSSRYNSLLKFAHTLLSNLDDNIKVSIFNEMKPESQPTNDENLENIRDQIQFSRKLVLEYLEDQYGDIENEINKIRLTMKHITNTAKLAQNQYKQNENHTSTLLADVNYKLNTIEDKFGDILCKL